MNFFRDVDLVLENGEYAVKMYGKTIVLSPRQQAALKAKDQKPGKVIMGVRPVHMTLSDDGFEARVDVSEMMGSELHLHLSLNGMDVVAVIPTAGMDIDNIKSGIVEKFSFDPALVHLFDAETEKNLI